jgi:hypothetical protein
VRLESLSQPADRRKGWSAVQPEIPDDTPTPRRPTSRARRPGPISPEDRARRLAAIRAVLADAAPEFRARIARIAPIASGESEARP